MFIPLQFLKHLLLALLLFTLTNCAFVIKQSGNFDENPYYQKKELLPPKTFCPHNKRMLITSGLLFKENFMAFLSKLQNANIVLTPIEKFVLLALLQQNLRPDLASPTARLQVLTNNHGKQQYFNFIPNKELIVAMNDFAVLEKSIKESLPAEEVLEDSKNKKRTAKSASKPILKSASFFPYLFGLEQLLKSFNSSRSLLQLAEIIDKHYHYAFKVEKGFDQFLASMAPSLASSETWKRYFFREDEIITKGELLPKINYSKLIQNYLQSFSDLPREKLYSKKTGMVEQNADIFPNASLFSISCNQDLSLYNQNKLNISATSVETNIFGIQEGDVSILAASLQSPSSAPIYKDSILISGGIPSDEYNLVCLLVPKEKGMPQISFLIDHDRDPGQHAYHLLRKGLLKSRSTKDFDHYLKSSRYLILQNPLRLIVESQRMQSSETEQTFKLNLPIYNANSIARIIGHIYTTDESTFVTEERSEDILTCL
ncbi:MAG: hypothetical protein HQK52_07815 [Oligoflexia bacterium]|nr:hypothetical protein [Oligoflexia bacterium]